jgi:hypothetical protein
MNMTSEDAKGLALAVARKRFTLERNDDEIVIEEDKTEEREVGWVFWVQSRHHLETDSFDSMLMGSRAIFVNRSTGHASVIAGDAPTNLEVRGSPEHDWPAMAWLTMPLACVCQAVVWVAAWIAHDAIVRALGGILLPAGLVAMALAGVLATAPTALAVRWTEFANVRRRIPLLVVLTGTVIGEVVVSIIFMLTDAPELLPWSAVAAVPTFLAAQPGDYLALKGIAFVVMLGLAPFIGEEEKNTKRLWRGD